MPEDLLGIKEWRNKRNGFYVMQIHYTAHSKKRSAEWLAEAKKSIPPNDFRREMEIDFSSFAGKPVFLNDYDPGSMFVKCELVAAAPIIRAWDFGYHHPAVAWSQFVDGLQLQVLQSDLGSDIDFRLYVRKILHLSSLYFPNRSFIDCCDRAGDFKTTSGTPNEVSILRSEFGIVPIYKYFKVEYTIDEMRKLMHTTHKGKPCFLVNDTPSNQILNDALRGGYHYAEPTGKTPEKESPFEDHYFENIVDPIRYTVANFLGRTQDWQESVWNIARIDIPQEKVFDF